MAELGIGNPDRLSVDVGPVITAEAQRRHLATTSRRCARAATPVEQLPLPPATAARHLRAADDHRDRRASPTCKREVFGPVLHVLRYRRERARPADRRDQRHRLRPDLRPAHAASTRPSRASPSASRGRQLYVNRNIIGAVVGVQPFGGHGLSGTGPKAGGPLYLRRLLSKRPPSDPPAAGGRAAGPVGERNSYALRPKGTILCVARDPARTAGPDRRWRRPPAIAPPSTSTTRRCRPCCSTAAADDLLALSRRLAERDGPIVPIMSRPIRWNSCSTRSRSASTPRRPAAMPA